MERYVDKGLRPTGGLIPLLNPLKVKSIKEPSEEGEYVLYMLRLTPMEQYTRDDVKVLLQGITDNWVLAKEDSKKAKEHYHITIYEQIDEEPLRTIIREFLKVYFPLPPKRGDANKQYNLTVADSVEKGINYTVKELDVEYGEGMNPEYIDKRIKASFIKFDRAEIAKRIDELKNNFKSSDMSITQFMETFCLIKADYRQPINLNYIYQLAVACDINRDNTRVHHYVRSYLDNKI
ncbi:MAG: putative replicase [Circoviridae sp.]|nr:MAG: putative replicase [Circoviridae sp.]